MGTFITLVVVVGLVGLAVRKMCIRDRSGGEAAAEVPGLFCRGAD